MANIVRLNKQIEVTDIMTLVFEELGLGNKNTGQFFTPTAISDMMAQITISDMELEQHIKSKGYVGFHEPATGAGGMILAFAREVKIKGFDTYRNLYVEAWDIDILCTYLDRIYYSING